MDELRPGLERPRCDARHLPDAAAQLRVRLDDEDARGRALLQRAGGGEPCGSPANDDDVKRRRRVEHD